MTQASEAPEDCTTAEALAAVRAAARPHHDGRQVVSGVIGANLSTPWTVEAALMMVATAVDVSWRPEMHAADGHGLVVTNATDGTYRFATGRPGAVPAVLTPPTLALVPGGVADLPKPVYWPATGARGQRRLPHLARHLTPAQ